ncbi:ubiquinol-cytochrome-c reductase complex assembly factor 1-like [Pomacea canaliculata]|uniref:ubiquinol-cytochrome-c reductase complex assembly factor 1-like n=1 Tax=Pomacea canaliculata TaxID=400727 RepID=UPI000D72E603|nr:ubiquinol-cytochrome-c reductase complex assembly factor 1-like [Pomacea canaliculata]
MSSNLVQKLIRIFPVAGNAVASSRQIQVPHLLKVVSCSHCIHGIRWSSNCLRVRAQYSTVASGSGTASEKKGSLWQKIKWDLGFISGLKYSKSLLNASSFRMYICCSEMIHHNQFFLELDLPDTFTSWFLVTDLHVWLCMQRLSSLGKDGRLLCNFLVQALWNDMEARSKLLGNAISLTSRSDGIQELAGVFKASLFAYDEGLLGDDKELAAAVWRILFEMRKDIDPQKLELVVHYIRKQVAHLDSQDEKTILGKGFVTFLPLHGEKLDESTVLRQTMNLLGKNV